MLFIVAVVVREGIEGWVEGSRILARFWRVWCSGGHFLVVGTMLISHRTGLMVGNNDKF